MVMVFPLRTTSALAGGLGRLLLSCCCEAAATTRHNKDVAIANALFCMLFLSDSCVRLQSGSLNIIALDIASRQLCCLVLVCRFRRWERCERKHLAAAWQAIWYESTINTLYEVLLFISPSNP